MFCLVVKSTVRLTSHVWRHQSEFGDQANRFNHLEFFFLVENSSKYENW